jgi:hypothetical protein
VECKILAVSQRFVILRLEMEIPFFRIPVGGSTDFVSSYRIIFCSWLLGGFEFKRDDGGSRRRRGHNKREEKSIMANGCERKMIGKMPGVS